MNHLRTCLRGAPVLLLLLASPPRASCQIGTAADFTFNPATASVRWTLNSTLHTVHGTFRLTRGRVHIDAATGEASGLIVIDAASGESGDAARDRRMHREILESSRFPAITFRPTHIDRKADLSAPGPIQVDGILSLHGQDHPLRITVDLRPAGAAIASHTNFTIPFVAWGLKDPSTFIFRVDKQVTLDIDAAAIPASGPAQPE